MFELVRLFLLAFTVPWDQCIYHLVIIWLLPRVYENIICSRSVIVSYLEKFPSLCQVEAGSSSMRDVIFHSFTMLIRYDPSRPFKLATVHHLPLGTVGSPAMQG